MVEEWYGPLKCSLTQEVEAADSNSKDEEEDAESQGPFDDDDVSDGDDGILEDDFFPQQSINEQIFLDGGAGTGSNNNAESELARDNMEGNRGEANSVGGESPNTSNSRVAETFLMQDGLESPRGCQRDHSGNNVSNPLGFENIGPRDTPIILAQNENNLVVAPYKENETNETQGVGGLNVVGVELVKYYSI